MRNLCSFFLLFVVAHVYGYGQPLSIKRVEPLNWWVGMAQPEVQLLVYGDGIATWEPMVDYPGVTLQQSHGVENPNYLFLDIHIGSAAKAGRVDIRFSKTGEQPVAYAYELKNREQDRPKAQGIASEDLIYLIMPDRFANGDTAN